MKKFTFVVAFALGVTIFQAGLWALWHYFPDYMYQPGMKTDYRLTLSLANYTTLTVSAPIMALAAAALAGILFITAQDREMTVFAWVSAGLSFVLISIHVLRAPASVEMRLAALFGTLVVGVLGAILGSISEERQRLNTA